MPKTVSVGIVINGHCQTKRNHFARALPSDCAVASHVSQKIDELLEPGACPRFDLQLVEPNCDKRQEATR